MQYKKQVKKWGDSLAIIIPSDLAKYLDLDVETDIVIQDDTGKHGKFISVWKDETV